MKNKLLTISFISLLLLLSACGALQSPQTTTPPPTQADPYASTNIDANVATTTPVTPATLDVSNDSNASNASISSNPTSMSKFDQLADPKKGDQIAVIVTSKGTIKVRFFPEYAPETVKNFVELSKKKFYDGLIFHRVIKDFMIQGGDPSGTGAGGQTYKGPGTTLKAEIVPELKNKKGTLSMARKGGDYDSASSQFFIVQKDGGYPSLDGEYTVFGQVFSGLTIVDDIAKVKTDEDDKPLTPVIIKTITIEAVK